MKFKKYFTTKEANNLLPEIKRVVQLILSISREYYGLSSKNENVARSARLEGLQTEFQNYLKEIEDLGCFYKGTGSNEGLVDFPALLGDEEVFLCWKSDEDTITHYHPIETGFSGRETLPDELRESE